MTEASPPARLRTLDEPLSPRLRTLDAVRGVAVMGIFLLNVIDMAMPGYAYVDPNYYGGASGANWWEWAVVYVVADGKMRGLFTMMFGASTVLIAERALNGGGSPARTHYARMATLFAFGMVHAYLIWSGDILVLYSICGALIFFAWRSPPRLLLAFGAALLLWKLTNGVVAYNYLSSVKAEVSRPNPSASAVADWRAFLDQSAPSRDAIPGELAGYRGSYRDALDTRVPTAIFMQTIVAGEAVWDTLGLMLMGMGLFRYGFFSGAWSRRRYWLVAAPIPLLWAAYVPLVDWLDRTRFAPLTLTLTEPVQLVLLRPLLSLGYAALVILFVQSGRVAWLADRLAATGRMAFSNYLGTSIFVTLFFNGYGLGWYGYLERWQCLIVVGVVWLAMLAWSKPWLDRFAYGPFEWLWRSAARGKLQPFKVANASQ